MPPTFLWIQGHATTDPGHKKKVMIKATLTYARILVLKYFLSTYTIQMLMLSNKKADIFEDTGYIVAFHGQKLCFFL